MTGAMIVIAHAQLRTSRDIVVGFLCAAGCAIRPVRVRLSDASGVAIEEKIWFDDSTNATALAEEVARDIARSAGGQSDPEATITVSDDG
jgi:hypothetical protein